MDSPVRPPGAIQFRPATARDAANVAGVYLASRRAFLHFAPPAHTDDEVRRWVADTLIASGGVTVAVADGGTGPVVGMMALQRRDDVGWLDQLYLHPDAVGQGLGTRLLVQAMVELGPPIRLYTFQANTGARRFYERHGFRAIRFGDGSGNEENCPDVLYEWTGGDPPAGTRPAVTIRRAVPGDESALRDLRIRALTDSPNDFGSTLERERNRTPEDWRRWLTEGSVYLAETGDGPIGLAAGVPNSEDPSTAYLCAVWVQPAIRGSDAARNLISAVQGWARDTGFRELKLDVVEENGRARRAYERNGFRVTGRVTIRERDGVREIEMIWRPDGPPRPRDTLTATST